MQIWKLRMLLIGLVAANAALAAAAPTISKDSVQVTAFTYNSYSNKLDTWSWTPAMQFRVNGDVAKGAQFYGELTIPGAGDPLKVPCPRPQLDDFIKCGAREVPSNQATTYTGPVSFAIKMRNEVTGEDVTLFTGKTKVVKVHSSEQGPNVSNHFVYYVNQDWNLPIGYLFFTRSLGNSDSVKRPQFLVAFWVRGDSRGLEPHLFYQGKEVGRISIAGNEAGLPACSFDEVRLMPPLAVDDSLPQKARWTRVACIFPNVYKWDKSGLAPSNRPGQVGSAHVLSENPGEYEAKILWKGHLARSIKFSVGKDGKVDSGIAAANPLGSDRIIVPVQILGDQDGQWDRNAWKTEAFYGNLLKGFQPAQ